MDEKQLAEKIIAQSPDFPLWVARPSSVQRDELVKLFLNHLVNTDYLAIIIEGNNTGFFCHQGKLNQFYQEFGQKLLNQQFAVKHLKDYKIFAKRLLRLGQKSLKLKAEPKDLIRFYQEWLKALQDYSLFFLTPYLIENQFEPQLKELLKKEFPDQAEEYFAVIAYPTIIFSYQQYQLDLLQMGDKIDYKKLIKRYQWIPEYSYKENLLNDEMIDAEVKNIKENALEKQILNIKVLVTKNKKAYAQVMKAIKVNEQIKVLAELLHNYVNIRTERIEVFKQAQTNLRSFYRQVTAVSKKYLPEIEYLDVVNLTDLEIVNLLEQKVTFNLAEVRQRVKKQYVSYGQVGKEVQFIYDPQLISQIKAVYTKVEKAESFKGIIAFQGKISGPVKIIVNKSDFNKFKDNDILVTQFTTPDYVPLMKKASAIITNDGGITCHAAIISRELKKPCIVGTKIATKVLKDGDMVEVDADKGIIKIIN